MPRNSVGTARRWQFWLAVLAFEASLVAFLAFMTVSRWQSGQTAINDALEELDRMQSVAAYRAQLEGATPQDLFVSAFLPSKPVALLSADEITSLKTMAMTAGVEMQAANPLGPREEGAITWVGVNTQATGAWPATLAMLQQIERAEPVLVFDRLVLRTMQPLEMQQASDTILTLEADVVGAMRNESVTSATPASP